MGKGIDLAREAGAGAHADVARELQGPVAHRGDEAPARPLRRQPEPYPEGRRGTGRFWTQKELDSVGKGCGTRTTMKQALAETYARNPHFYGATYCCGCSMHRPVGEDGEFVWDGTEERVGT